MAILRKRKKVEDHEVEEPVILDSVAPTLPGYGVRIVSGGNHRLLMLVDGEIPGDVIRDFSAKSCCEAWIVDFSDPDLPANIEAWRNK